MEINHHHIYSRNPYPESPDMDVSTLMDPEVWYCVFATGSAVILAMWILLRLNASFRREGYERTSFWNTATQVVWSLQAQGSSLTNQVQVPNLMIVFGIWILMMSVVQWGLIGLVHSLITAPAKTKPIDTLDDMIDAIENRDFWWGGGSNSMLYYYAETEVDDRRFKRLKSISNITKGTKPSRDLVRRSASEKFILVDVDDFRLFFRQWKEDSKFIADLPLFYKSRIHPPENTWSNTASR